MSTRTRRHASRFDVLPIEETEPDEPNASHASGASPQTRRTRQSSTQSASQISPVAGLLRSLNQMISLIDKDSHKGGWWLTFRTELRSKLKSAVALAANLPSDAHEISATMQEATPVDAQEQVTSQEPPSAHQAATAPVHSITILDVEAAVARAVERGLREVRERLDAIPTASPNSALPSAQAHSCATHDHPHPPPPRALPQATERDITVSLAGVTSTDALRACSEAEIKATVDAALASNASRDHPKHSVAGVRKLPNGDIRIRTSSESVKDNLVSESSSWLQALAPGAQLIRERYTVEVRAVPTTFRPDEDYAVQALYSANAETFASAASILAVRWLRDPGQNKRAASLLLDLDSMHAFHHAIYNGISIRGRLCDVCPFVPAPVQCYFCQAWGHIVTSCPRRKEEQPITCARCAGPHATSACVCPHTPRCSSLRECPHIVSQCANCGGRHKSLSVDCPARRRAAEEVARRPKYARLLAAYASPPPRTEATVAAGDARRSLPFSNSPRAGSAWES